MLTDFEFNTNFILGTCVHSTYDAQVWIANLNSNPSCKSLNLDGKFFKMLMNVKYFFCIMYYMFICECYFFEVITLTIIRWTSMTSTGTFLTKRRMHLLRWKHKKKYLFQCKIYALPILFTNLCWSEHKGPLSLAAGVTSFNKSWLTCHYTLSSYLKFRVNGDMSNRGARYITDFDRWFSKA